MGEVTRQIELARHAPGATEAALVERTARILTEDAVDYDHVVFDTAPTGHAMRLITLPELLGRWTETLLGHHEKMQDMERVYDFLGGKHSTGHRDKAANKPNAPEKTQQRQITADILRARRDLYRAAAKIITDPARAAFVAVATPEKLPVLEVERILAFLKEQRMKPGLLVMNKILPDHLSDRFLIERKSMEAGYIERLKRASACAQCFIPLQEKEAIGIQRISDIIPYLQS
jgi:arsenite-transporting ATPase